MSDMTALSSFPQFMSEATALLEAELRVLFPDEWDIEPQLRSSMEYSLFAGGKRIRPVLLFAALDALAKPYAHGLKAACSLEMIHTYSLIHDDLPAMDDDDLRRGKPTNHVVFGEATAILAGDGLLTHAFYVLARTVEEGHADAATVVQMIAELARCAGVGGMVSGQAADMAGEQGLTSIAQLSAIHRGKTGALIATALKMGGLLGGANAVQLQALETFGYRIGLAFQILDDVLDVIGDPEKLGKPLGSDEKSQKVTYPYFLGVDGSRAEVRKLTEEAKQAVAAAVFPHPQRLYEFADFLLAREF